MLNVLVLAEDECIRFTCAEVLTRLGFRASAVAAPVRDGRPDPDAVLIWEASFANLPVLRAAYGQAPLLVCTWDYHRPWPDSVIVVPLPFNVERVALELDKACRSARRPPSGV